MYRLKINGFRGVMPCSLVVTLISGFHRDADEICALLGYYTTSCGNCLPTCQENLSVPSSRIKSPSLVLLTPVLQRYLMPQFCALKMEAAGASEIFITSYQTAWHCIPQDSNFSVHCHDSPKSHKYSLIFISSFCTVSHSLFVIYTFT
jgi:hypothetical protein